jgi:lipopolysaccharide biosynthesis glycosyltransferase
MEARRLRPSRATLIRWSLLLLPLLVVYSWPQSSPNEQNDGHSGDIVQVAVAADRKNLRIVRALLASVVVNSQRAFVHIIHAEDASRVCQELVDAEFTSVARCVLWQEESIMQVSSLIRVVSGQNSSACSGLEGCDQARAKRLSNSFNFARFFLADILPDLDRVIWMDCDVVITNRMDSIWEQSKRSNALVSAFMEPVRFGRFYLQEVLLQHLMKERFEGVQLDMEADSFNDGVIVINLKRWRDSRVREALLWLMGQHGSSQTGLWKYGTQPIMMLLGTAYGWERLPSSHCYGDLGFKIAEPQRVEEAVFLHFNGENKPWKENGINKHLWEPYYHRHDRVADITL